jgi:head-tail joining protein
MAWITSQELTDFRNVASNIYPDTCVIQAETDVSDGAGGLDRSWASVTGGTVACRFDPVSGLSRGGQQIIGGAEGAIFDYIVSLPNTAPIAMNRRLVHNGNTYEIVGLADDHSWQITRKVFAARIE